MMMAGQVAMDLFQPIVDMITETITVTLVEVGTFWIGMDTEAVDDPAGPVKWLHGELDDIVIAAATLSVIIAGVKMAISSRGEAAKDVLRSLLTLIVVMFLGLSIIGGLVKAGDEFSKCMIASSITPGLGAKDPKQLGMGDLQPPPAGWTCTITPETRKDFGANILAGLGMTGPGGAALGIIGIMFIGSWAAIAAIVQIMMMVVRNGMLVVLVGVLPLTAAATNTEIGRTWFKRCVSWLTAFLLYKPIAALVYAAALTLMRESARAATTSGGGPVVPVPGHRVTGVVMAMVPLDTPAATAFKNGITAVVMMTLAILALPALMKFLTPLVGAAAGGAGLMATFTPQGAQGHEMVAAADDQQAPDVVEGPTGATNTGSSHRASSGAGRRGASGARGATGTRGRKGSDGQGDKGKSGGETPPATSSGGQGGQGGQAGQGDGGQGGTGNQGGGQSGGGTGGTGGTGGSGGGTGGGSGPRGQGGSGTPGTGGQGGLGPDGVPLGDGPGGSSDLVPGQSGKGPAGAADTVRRFSRKAKKMGDKAEDIIDDAVPNEGPSGSS